MKKAGLNYAVNYSKGDYHKSLNIYSLYIKDINYNGNLDIFKCILAGVL